MPITLKGIISLAKIDVPKHLFSAASGYLFTVLTATGFMNFHFQAMNGSWVQIQSLAVTKAVKMSYSQDHYLKFHTRLLRDMTCHQS